MIILNNLILFLFLYSFFTISTY